MGSLIYSMLASADGYVKDAAGGFEWAEPDDEVHAFINERMRPVGTFIHGRRMYETMAFWETSNDVPGMSLANYEFGSIWRAAQKIVVSTTLDQVQSARTHIVRTFDADAVRALKEATPHDITIDGPTLAWQAVDAGLVDEFAVYTMPVAVGGGMPFFPMESRVDLTLEESRSFASGVVFSRYRVRPRSGFIPT